MKTIIHIYPQRIEATRAIEKIDHPRADKHHACLFIDYHCPKERHIYLAGIQSEKVRTYKPDMFIVHDRERCYGPVLEAVREVSWLNKIKVIQEAE